MTDTFNFPIQTKPTGTTAFSTRSVPFGDGYQQMAGNGMNVKKQSWACVFDGDYDEAEDLKAFLDAHAGYLSFLWTPPNGVPLYFVCPGYTELPNVATQCVVNFTLNQVFFP